MPYLPEDLPAEPAEREDFLSESYETIETNIGISAFEERVGIDVVQEVLPNELPSMLTGLGPGADGYYATNSLLVGEAVPLDENGEIPYLVPYEPTVYDNENNDFDNAAFEDVDIDSAYQVYQSAPDSDGNPYSLFSPRSFSRIVESIATGTPDGGYVEPTEAHLPYRQVHTVNISDPMPVINISSISTCDQPIEGAGSRVDPYIIYTYEQFNFYLRSEQSILF